MTFRKHVTAREGLGSPLLDMLERSGLRPHPANRRSPDQGDWMANCPICSAESTLWVERGPPPHWQTWSTTCGCVPRSGTINELLAVLLAVPYE
jgi:hypothetical protein